MMIQILRDCGEMKIIKTLLCYYYKWICDNFFNYPQIWVSKLQTQIYLSTLNYQYVVLYHSIRTLLPLQILIKEVIDDLGSDCEKLKFVSSSTFYKDNNGSIVVEISPRVTAKSKHIDFKYHSFRKHFGKEFLIRKIESENQKADIFTKVLQGELFVRIRKLLCGW